MEVQLSSTSKVVQLVTEQGVVEARVWEGQTASGMPVIAYITRVMVALADDQEQFQRELLEQRPPSLESQAIPLRLIL